MEGQADLLDTGCGDLPYFAEPTLADDPQQKNQAQTCRRVAVGVDPSPRFPRSTDLVEMLLVGSRFQESGYLLTMGLDPKAVCR
jgi:hypothetical protein